LIVGVQIFAVGFCSGNQLYGSAGALGEIGGAIPQPKRVAYQTAPSHPAQHAVKSVFKDRIKVSIILWSLNFAK